MGSPNPPRWPPPPALGEEVAAEEGEVRPPPPRNSWSRTSEVGTGQAGALVPAGAPGSAPTFVYRGPGRCRRSPFPAAGSLRPNRTEQGQWQGGPLCCHPPRRLIWARGGCCRADNPPRCRHRPGLRAYGDSVRGGSGDRGKRSEKPP